MGYVRLVSCYMPSYLPCCVPPSTHHVLMLYVIPIPTSLYSSLLHILVLSVMETVAVTCTGEVRSSLVMDTVKSSTDSRLPSAWMVISTQLQLLLALNVKVVAGSAV